MKKFILLAMIMVAAVSNVSAQQHNLWELWATPKVGAAASNFTTHGGDWMFGPRAGGDAEVFFNNHLSLTFDIHYSRIGSKNVYSPYTSKSGETVNSGPYNYHLDVLNTQYLGKYYIANGIALFTVGKASGNKPNTIVNEVIRIGRSRTAAASRAASTIPIRSC